MHRISMGLAIAVLGLVVVGCGSGSAIPIPEVSPTEPSAVTAAPVAEVAPTAMVGVESTVPLESADLAAFAEAWSSGEIEAIRAFYTDDAVYVSAEQAVALQRKEPVSVLVAEDAFAERVREHQGLRMRIMGEPIQVSDKIVGFAFRWEESGEGYNGVALLRYEGGRIWLHTYAVSTTRTSNLADEAMLQPVDLDGLMEAWSAGDVSAIRGFYTDTDGVFAVFNDEEIANSLRGIVYSPQELAGGYVTREVWSHATQWGMTVVGQPLRLGDLVLYAWGWKAFDYPVGYGVRLMRYDGAKINIDIRYAIRPWKAQGQSFVSGF